MCSGGFTEALRLRPRDLDGRLEVDPELLASGRVSGTDHEAIAQTLRIADDERLGEDDDLRAAGRGLTDQPDRLVDAGLGVERHRTRLHDGNPNR